MSSDRPAGLSEGERKVMEAAREGCLAQKRVIVDVDFEAGFRAGLAAAVSPVSVEGEGSIELDSTWQHHSTGGWSVIEVSEDESRVMIQNRDGKAQTVRADYFRRNFTPPAALAAPPSVEGEDERGLVERLARRDFERDHRARHKPEDIERMWNDRARTVIGSRYRTEARAFLAASPSSPTGWEAWLCPVCGECQAKRGIRARCAGSLTEGTAHAATTMEAAVVSPSSPTGDHMEMMQRFLTHVGEPPPKPGDPMTPDLRARIATLPGDLREWAGLSSPTGPTDDGSLDQALTMANDLGAEVASLTAERGRMEATLDAVIGEREAFRERAASPSSPTGPTEHRKVPPKHAWSAYRCTCGEAYLERGVLENHIAEAAAREVPDDR